MNVQETLVAAHARTSQGGVATRIVDCDVHLAPRDEHAVGVFLDKRWQEHARSFQRRFSAAFYPRRSEYGERFDAWPPSGLRPGADFDFVREQHLDGWDLEYAVITPTSHPQTIRNLEFSAAIARAMNKWQVEAWLARDNRLRGSILVATEHSEAAVEEIEQWSQDNRFVQVYLYSSTAEPIGRRRYWPMLAAAERCGLPVAMHFGSGSGNAPTGVGFPSYYLEEHAGVATTFQDQVTSLIFEGALERFRSLRFVLVEGGFAWLAPLMWRLDRAWRQLGREVPHVTRLPSETIREQMWYTTQPVEEPPTDDDFRALVDQLGGPSRMMFASDYPHWDFDAPDRALPASLGESARRRMYAENAKALYGLSDRERAAGR